MKKNKMFAIDKLSFTKSLSCVIMQLTIKMEVQYG